MKPTAEQIEKLARVFSEGMTGYPEDFEDFFIDEDNVICTRETLEDYRKNSQNWNQWSTVKEIDGGLFWEEVQALKGQPRVAVAVIDCGEFRLSYQQ